MTERCIIGQGCIIATYGAETWTLNQETIRRIESFEMWCWRRMLKVKWTEKKTNAEVLKEAHVERSLLTSIKKRNINGWDI